MYTSSQDFAYPLDENTKVWRYMSLGKFLSMLESRCLFFSHYTDDAMVISNILPQVTENRELTLFESKKARTGSNELPKAFTNSWQMNDTHMPIMWQTFANGDEGVAIQSTLARIRNGLEVDENEMLIGVVSYVSDLEQESSNEGFLSRYLVKEIRFEHERELRMIIRKPVNDTINMVQHRTGGILVPCNFDVLIESIHLSPSSLPWFKSLIEALLRRYGVEKPVVPPQI